MAPPAWLRGGHRDSTASCLILHVMLCRFVLELDRTRAYFFWLYVGYFCCEALLAVLALVWYPPKGQLLLWSPHEEGYLVRGRSACPRLAVHALRQTHGLPTTDCSRCRCIPPLVLNWHSYCFLHALSGSFPEADCYDLPWQPLTGVPADEAAEGSLSPEATAGLFSTLTFKWISPLMSKARFVSICSSAAGGHFQSCSCRP